MHTQKILKGKLLAREMCVGCSREICDLRGIESPSWNSDTSVGGNVCIRLLT